MRARLYTELDEANGDVSHADTARADVQKAEAAFDMYFEGFSAEQKAIVRANIASAISPEKKIRRDAIDEIESSLKAFPPSKSQPDGNAMMDDRLTPRAKANTTGGAMSRLKMILTAVWVRTPAALIGAVLWGIPVLLFSQKSESGPGPMGYFATFIAIALFIFAMKGWDWNSQYKMGTYGNFFKFLALMGIMITGVGFIFAFFWTGKSVLRLFAKK